MKSIIGILSLALLVAAPSLQARKHKHEAQSQVIVVFSSGDARMIHEHYRAYPQSLPPGLAKKLARGGTLPPGWRKKIAPFPVELERRMPPLACGECRRGIVEGHAVIYNPRTWVTLDVVAILER